MLKMFDELGTSASQKVKKAFPDAGEHVIGCELTSGCVDEVIAATIDFGEKILDLKPVQ